MRKSSVYVLITPVRNEEATIQTTIESVLRQTILPREWVIVSDGSTDHTDKIIMRFAAANSFIRYLRLENRPKRSFASVVFVTESGLKHLESTGYDFIGLLDGDVRFGGDYFERLISKFDSNPRLGLAGGLVSDITEGFHRKAYQNLNEVAGATQFFKRECFESLGGLLAIPEGGWDAITCVQARMNGYKTATFPDLAMDHLKPRNVAEGNLLRRNWQFGMRDHALASHPLFEAVKCGARVMDFPPLIGSISRLGGYCWAAANRRKCFLPSNIIDFIRREQLMRVLPAYVRRRPS